MTRRSKRDLESSVESMDDGAQEDVTEVTTAYRTSDGWVDGDGEPVPEDARIILGIGGVTMARERAEREGYEILGPADAADPGYVTVPWDYGDDEEGGR